MDLFTFCDNIMYWLGDVTGLGYEAACVLFNIYGEYILVISSVLLLLIPCRKMYKVNKFIAVIMYLGLFLYSLLITAYVLLHIHHFMFLPLHEQFAISVQDVLREAKARGLSYQETTLGVFVYEPLFIMGFNIILYLISVLIHKIIAYKEGLDKLTL